MSKYLRHQPTGDVYLLTGNLAARNDMVPISEKEFKAAMKPKKVKPQAARAKKTVPAPVPEAAAPVAPAIEPQDIRDPGVDESTTTIDDLLGGDE